MHGVAVDDALIFDDVMIDVVKTRDRAGLPAPGGMFLSTDAEIEFAGQRRPVRTAAEPFVLGLLVGEGVEHFLRRCFPAAGYGEAGVNDIARGHERLLYVL